MKFVCDRCHTRYNISDEKVKGKVLKVRCKTCGNIIVVREKGAESAVTKSKAAAGGGRARGPKTSVNVKKKKKKKNTKKATKNTEWFVAIKGTQHGPMSKKGVIEFFESGKIHERSYCWHEELESWTRFRELPDFKDVLTKSEAAAQKDTIEPAAINPPPPPDDDGGGKVVSLDAHRQQREADIEEDTADAEDLGEDEHSQEEQEEHEEENASDVTDAEADENVSIRPSDSLAPGEDPFAAVAAASDLPAPADGAKRESTRVFIMNAGLHNRKQKHRRYAVMGVVAALSIGILGYLDYTGKVKIPILSHVSERIAKATGDEAKLKQIKMAKIDDAIDSDLDDEQAAAIRCEMMGDDCPVEERERHARRRRSPKKAAPGGIGDVDLEGAFAGNGGGKKDLSRKEGAADVNFGGLGSQATRSQNMVTRSDGFGTKPMSTIAPKDAIAVSGNELTGAQISKVVKNNKTAIQKCIEKTTKNNGGDMKTAKRKLKLVIKIDGRVQDASITHGPTNASDLGRCITRSAKKWVFPAASSESEVEIPLILSVF